MKNFVFKITYWALVGVLLAACTGTKSASGPRQKVRMGIDASYPPFETVDYEQRKLSGFDVDLMRAIADKAGLEVEFVNEGFDRVLTGVEQCQYDASISAIPVTDELKQKMSFSEPYVTVGQVVVVKKGNIAITGRDSLTGMTVGSQNGSTSAGELAKIPGAQAKGYATFDLAFQELIQGLIDAVVTDRVTAASYVAVKSNNLEIVGDEFAVEDYAIAVCNQKTDLLKKINDGLAAVKANGTLDKLVKKWLQSP